MELIFPWLTVHCTYEYVKEMAGQGWTFLEFKEKRSFYVFAISPRWVQWPFNIWCWLACRKSGFYVIKLRQSASRLLEIGARQSAYGFLRGGSISSDTAHALQPRLTQQFRLITHLPCRNLSPNPFCLRPDSKAVAEGLGITFCPPTLPYFIEIDY